MKTARRATPPTRASVERLSDENGLFAVAVKDAGLRLPLAYHLRKAKVAAQAVASPASAGVGK
jgi:hypothetical protein